MDYLSLIDLTELSRDFDGVADRATIGPILIRREGQGSLVLISAKEYARLKRRDRQVIATEDMPAAWLDAIAQFPT